MKVSLDNNRKVLIDLLSSAIRGKRLSGGSLAGVDWNAVYKEAEAHEIVALLFPVLKDLDAQQRPNPELMAKWQKATLVEGLMQIRHLEEMKRIFDRFDKAGIPVIALKGLILRELYPHPELRSMSDADILIHKDYVIRAKELLKQLGYFYENEYNSKHIEFYHDEHLTIELHWFLVYPESFPTAIQLENRAWENAVRVNFHTGSVLSLSEEDQLMHVCLHMASHIRSGGFGLRQLCDVVLLVENARNRIDWAAFKNNMEHFGVHRFIPAVFMVCNKLFGITIPKALYCMPDDPYLEMLFDDILSGGAYGFSSIDRIIGNGMLYYVDIKSTGRLLDRVVYYLTYIFPSPEKMSPQYAYSRRYPLLVPVAWLHRLIIFTVNKPFFSYFKNVILPKSKSVSIMKERAELLKWLGLR